MKADLYVQGHFWATIDLPGHSLLALLAKGMLTAAQYKADQLKADLEAIDGVECQISLRIKETIAYPPREPDSDHPFLQENTHAN